MRKFTIFFLVLLICMSFTFSTPQRSSGTFTIGSTAYHAYYDLGDRSKPLMFWDFRDPVSAYSGIQGYKLSPTVNWLTTTSCQFSYSPGEINLNFNPNIYMDSSRRFHFNGPSYNTQSMVSETILQTNYYALVNVNLGLFNSGGTLISTRSVPNQYVPFNGLSTSSSAINTQITALRSTAQAECNSNGDCGTYNIKLSTTSTEPKCNFGAGLAITNVASTTILSHTPTIPNPTINILSAPTNVEDMNFRSFQVSATDHFGSDLTNSVSCSYSTSDAIITGSAPNFNLERLNPQQSSGQIICSVTDSGSRTGSQSATVNLQSTPTPMPSTLDNSYFIGGENKVIINSATLSDTTLELNLEPHFQTTSNSFNPDSSWFIIADIKVILERRDITGNGVNEEFKSSNYPKIRQEIERESIAHGGELVQIDLESFFPGIKTGDYEVSVEITPITSGTNNVLSPQNVGDYNLFCDTSDDFDCDSILDERDLCPSTYGSAYFFGCDAEYVSTNGQPLTYQKEIINHYSDPFPSGNNDWGVISYDPSTDIISCWHSGSGDEYMTRSSSPKYPLANPPIGNYECYDRDFFSYDFAASATLAYSTTPINGVSVYDLDQDTLIYKPNAWAIEFGENLVPQDQADRCPASFGLVVDDGGPVTNEEDKKVTSYNELTFEDLNRNKLYFDQNTGAVKFNNITISIQSISKPVEVDITTSCIPTVRFSQLAKNNEDVKTKLANHFGTTNVNQMLGDGTTTQTLTLEQVKRINTELSITQKKELYELISRNGDCAQSVTRTDSMTIFSLLGALHYLQPVDATQKTVDVIDSVIATSNQLGLHKNVDPQENINTLTTRITLNISNIPPNTTIWQVIPKESVSDFDKLLDSVSLGNSDALWVKDKDPIIGWYFGSGGESGDLGFTINGTGEGGSTIPINSSLYFNSGELLVNYREGGCFASERELFTADHLSGGLIQEIGLTYSVCIAHNGTDDITSSAGTSEQYFSIQGNKFDTTTQTIDLYKETPVENYYDMYYGEHPQVLGYSCIGSLDASGLFGDCLYEPQNRIWMYYGPDPFPPTIRLTFYVPAHTISFKVAVNDTISGVDWSTTRYCVSDINSTCTPNLAYSHSQIVTISCPDSQGCLKKFIMEAADNHGNLARLEQNLTLLQKSSACNAQCLAAPTPNRYISSCRNVNGCQYFEMANETDPLDKGTYVADLCHYKIEGSWVNLGGGLELQCPSGPIRVSQFSDTDFEVDSQECDQIQTKRVPTLIDGEEVYLHIITCE